jgi:hypothetical protein
VKPNSSISNHKRTTPLLAPAVSVSWVAAAAVATAMAGEYYIVRVLYS